MGGVVLFAIWHQRPLSPWETDMTMLAGKLPLFFVAILLTLAATSTALAEVQPPNIVIILADDLGYGDVQCLNPQRGRIPTPHIDRLATQGMTFTDAHSSSAVCSPTRYTVLTGRYHWRTRLQSGIVNVFGKPLIAPDRLTIAGLLKQRGYRTACVGKWHLGWDWPIDPAQAALFHAKPSKDRPAPTEEQKAVWKDTFSKPIGGGPITRGFDEYFGTDVPNWPPYCFIENDRTIGIPSEFLPAKLLKNNQASLQGPALPGWTLEPILPALGDRACDYIERSAQRAEPFFLYMPLTSPHTPLAVNKPFQGKSGLNLYADFVMETDAVVGRVLEAIDNAGVADNTLVIFTSDNGCAPYVGAKQLEAKGHFPSGPYRGYKADVWEGGHRVPFFVRWPGVVKQGTSSERLICQSDLMATVAQIVGANLPDEAGEDSANILPLLHGEDRAVHEAVVHQSATGKFAIRTRKWKLLFCGGSGGWGIPTDRQAKQSGLPPLQLYDLETDPAETTNLQDKHPEIVERLAGLLEEYVAAGRSTPGTPQENDVPITIRK